MTLYPLLLEPALHLRVWGGRRLATDLHKVLPTHEPYGESWEMHDTATVCNGPLAGRTLGDVLAEYGAALVGPDHDPAVGLPLLVKFLDAVDWLSVQVHPNDAQAREFEHEPRGKTEAWYVISAMPGAQLIAGLRPGTTREAMIEAIHTQTLHDLLVYMPVTTGDVIFMGAGTVHALGPGLLIYEIQQSSDITYRLYDWGRMGLDGKPRPLHVEKGVAVSDMGLVAPVRHTGENTLPVVDLVQSDYFTTLLHQMNPRNGTRITLDTGGTQPHILTSIEHEMKVTAGDISIRLAKGQTALIPASVGAYTLTGTGRVLRSF